MKTGGLRNTGVRRLSGTIKRGMNYRLKEAIDDALVSRGKRKGMLKAKCPPMDTDGAAVWQAIMSYSNPHKVGFGHMIFMSKECKELYDYVRKAGEYIDLSTFDTDGNVLRELKLM